MHIICNKSIKLRYIILFLTAFLLIIAARIIYQPGLYGPLLLDDNEVIVPLLKEDINKYNWHQYIYSDSSPLKRPVSMLSFLLNVKASANDIAAWKRTNLMIHFINGILILYLSYLIVLKGSKKNAKYSLLTGCIVSFIWIVHPLHVSTVLYTVQRMTQLSASFFFISLIFYILGRDRQLQQKMAIFYFILAFLLFYPLSILSKENGVIMPLICILFEIFYFKFESLKKGEKNLNISLLIVLITPILLGLIYLILNYHVLLIEGYQSREFTLSQRLLTELRIILIYIFQIIIPMQKYMGFIHDDIEISYGLLTPPETLVSLIMLGGLIVFIINTYKWNKLISLGLCFYLFAHLVESTLLPLELMYEHRNYVPSFGIIMAVVGIMEYISANIRYILYMFVFSIFMFVTMQRVDTWSSLPSLYDYMFKTHPKSPRMAMLNAKILTDNGMHEEARNIISSFNKTGVIIQSLNIECHEKNVVSDAMFTRAILRIYKPVDMAAMDEIKLLSNSGLQKNCNYSGTSILNLLNKLIQIPVINKYQLHKLYVYKAYHLWDAKEYKEAIVQLEIAGEIVKDDPIPYVFAAAWSFKIGDMDAYNKYCNKVMEIDRITSKNYAEEIKALKQLTIN